MNLNDDNNDDFNFDYDNLSQEEKDEMDKEMEEEHRQMENHQLYKKAMNIYDIARSLVDTMSEDEKDHLASNLLESAGIIPAKFAGAFGSGSWHICMQNASIIRYHASHLLLENHSLREFTNIDKDYIQLLRREMEEFQVLFKEWVATFDKLDREDYEDEWGLFVRK